jgi:hypothetical protein
MRSVGRTVERELARIAGAQHGVVTRALVLEAGVSAAAIQRRARKGVLLPQHPGVYRVGHRAPSVEATYVAAVLACGAAALLCGRAAAHLLRLAKGVVPEPEVMAPTERRIAGIRTRRCRRMDARDGTTFRGIAVTTVPSTLVDLAAVLSLDELARVCHEAGVLYRTTPAPGARGPRPRRRIPPLHLRRRVRGTGPHARRAGCGPGAGPRGDTGWTCRRRLHLYVAPEGCRSG